MRSPGILRAHGRDQGPALIDHAGFAAAAALAARVLDNALMVTQATPQHPVRR